MVHIDTARRFRGNEVSSERQETRNGITGEETKHRVAEGKHFLFSLRDTYRVAINKRTACRESAIIRDPLALNT